MNVRFETEDGRIVERTFTEPFAIGRAAACQVQGDAQSVSRVHAQVVFEDEQWRVQDAGSRNGLFVEGRRVAQVTVSGPMGVRLGPSGPLLHVSVAYPEALKPDPSPRIFYEPEAPAPSRPPPPAASWPEPTPPSPLEVTTPVEAPSSWTWPPAPPPPVEPSPPASRPAPLAEAAPQATAPAAPTPYRADGFAFSLNEGWVDNTVYILNGPVADGFQHSITIHVEPAVAVEALLDYAEAQMQALQAGLTECRLLKTDQLQLLSGLPAYRAIFVWCPAEGERLYQEQLYVLHRQTGYILTAAFTRKTRKTLGPQVEQVMLSFTPQE